MKHQTTQEAVAADFDGHALLELIDQPLLVFAENSRLLAANSKALSILGLKSDDLLGHTCQSLFGSDFIPSPGEHLVPAAVANHPDVPEFALAHNQTQLRLRVTRNAERWTGIFLELAVNQPEHPSEQYLVGRSESMSRLIEMIERVAPTQATVLLLGESGVGKERVADHLHRHSRRATGPLVVVDCSTLGENLIEAELFGYEKGAFTGADRRKIGLFEAAEGGTLFIDEVGEMPLAMQSKLLRALETSRIRRLGGTDYIAVDARVIAATHRDLATMVQEGQFREDLFYRLSAFPIQIPPLRERPDDILALAEHFLQHSEAGDAALPLGPEVREMLLGYQFPGNVRELKNIISRAAILAEDGPLRPEHIAFQAVRRSDIDISAGRIPRSRNRLSTERILAVLQACDGHRSEAARQLGISERTLYRHLQKIPEY